MIGQQNAIPQARQLYMQLSAAVSISFLFQRLNVDEVCRDIGMYHQRSRQISFGQQLMTCFMNFVQEWGGTL